MIDHRFRIVRLVLGLLLLASASLVPLYSLPQKITVAGLKGPTSIGMLQLMDQKPAMDGVPTTFEVVSTPDLMVSRILTGNADFAFLPLNLAANLYAKGVPIELAATTGDGVLYVLTSRPDVKKLADLKGKTIYDIARGSTPEFMLDYVLEHNGINPSRDLTIDFTYSHIELAQQMAAGRVDLGVLPEPFATIALSKNHSLRVAFDLQKEWGKLHDTGTPYPTSALVVRSALAKTDPALVRRLLEAEKESIHWVNTHPVAAGRLANEFLGLPAGVVAQAMPRLNLRFVPAAEAYPDVQAFLGDFLKFDAKSIGGKLPDSGFYFGR